MGFRSQQSFQPGVVGPPSLAVRLSLAGTGAVPVSLIGLSTLGVWDLKRLAVGVLAPAVVLLMVLLLRCRTCRRLAAQALGAGLLSTFLYDLVRWWFLVMGWMNRDPIPHIGSALGLEPGWLFGYLWRFVGNGGGIALAFYAFGASGIVAGTLHGLFVCCGLLAVLQFSPHGQTMLFPLGPATLFVAIVGHVVYGAALGALSTRWSPALAPMVDLGRLRR